MWPITQFTERPGILDLGCGHPSPGLLPVEPWLAAAGASARSYGWQALTYGTVAGPGPLIEWLSEHLATTNFFITAGASHALALITGLLAEPGDTVLVDAPTYHFALRILGDCGVRLVAAPPDLDACITSLRAAGHRVPMMYLVPTFGNPTGASVPAERRRYLVDVTHRAGVTLVEDDTYRELAYDGPAPVSLWDLAAGPGVAGSGVIRIGSFAKTVAPGLRLGWINAVPSLIARLSELGYVDSGGGVNHANALTMASFCTSGSFDRHVTDLRAAYRERRDVLAGALRGFQISVPAGGWFLWARLPDGLLADDLLPVAEKHGVSFVPGPRFFPGGDDGHQYLRLAYSFLDLPELAEAADRLSRAVSGYAARSC
jgi:DNA-binding transcriptional MocR family regulator